MGISGGLMGQGQKKSHEKRKGDMMGRWIVFGCK